MFIAGEPPEVAERFIRHRAVKSYEDGLQQRKYASRLGSHEITPEEWQAIETKFRTVINRYGHDFAGAYGCAKPSLQIKNPNRKGSVTVSEIEKTVVVDLWVPHFLMATYAVHPSATT